MDSEADTETSAKTVATIGLTQRDLVRLTAIEIDRDSQDALAFVRERILAELRRQQNSRLKGALDMNAAKTKC